MHHPSIVMRSRQLISNYGLSSVIRYFSCSARQHNAKLCLSGPDKHPADQFFEEHIVPLKLPHPIILNPFHLKFFQTRDQTFEDVLNREYFLVPIVDQLIRRHDLVEDLAEGELVHRNNVSLMAAWGYCGIGKTTCIGFIMDLFNRMNIGGENRSKVANYLGRFHPSQTVDRFINAAAGYIVIPITFNSYQVWDESERNAAVSVWSRAVVNVLACAGIHETFGALGRALSRYTVDADFAMHLLGRIFKTPARDLKLFLCIDDFHKVKDENSREEILCHIGCLMDTYPRTLAFVTSRGPLILDTTISNSYLPVVKCDFTPTPSVLKTLDVWPILDKKPELVPLALDALSYPKDVDNYLDERHLRDYIVLLKSQIRIRLTDGYSGFSMHFLNSGEPGNYYNSESGEKFVEMISDASPIVSLTKKNTVLLLVGLLKNLSLAAFCKHDAVSDSPYYLFPITSQADFAAVVIAHPSIKSGGNVAAVWGLLMCLVRPWRAHEGFMMELLFLFNECRARQAFFHGGNYFESSNEPEDDTKPCTYAELFENLEAAAGDVPSLTFKTTTRQTYSIGYVESAELDQVVADFVDVFKAVHEYHTFPIEKMIVKLQPKKESNKPVVKGKCKGRKAAKVVKPPMEILSLLSAKDLGRFRKGGMFLLNVPSGAGYDYVLVDGTVLTFYETKYSKPQIAGQAGEEDGQLKHGQLSMADIARKASLCEEIHRAFVERTGKRCKVKEWRLIINAYRKVDIEGDLPKNVVVLDPEQCLLTVPPTMANRVELAKETEAGPMVERYANVFLEMAKENAELLRMTRKYKC